MSPDSYRLLRMLEVGCATGKATLPLARLGFRITALEPGAALATAARANLAGYEVDVVEARFEDWEPDSAVFDLVFAATAWHRVDPDVRYSKAAAVLRPRGRVALWGAGHVIPYDGDPFFEEIQEVLSAVKHTCRSRYTGTCRSAYTGMCRSRPVHDSGCRGRR